MRKNTGFGQETLTLVGPYLSAANAKRAWLNRAPLAKRVEMLLHHGAPLELVDKVSALWHGHTGPIAEFDDSEVTVVEIAPHIFMKYAQNY